MSHQWRVIGKVYDNKTGDLFGNIISISGGRVTVEVTDSDDVLTIGLEELKQRYGVRVEWTSVTPAGWHLGEF